MPTDRKQADRAAQLTFVILQGKRKMVLRQSLGCRGQGNEPRGRGINHGFGGWQIHRPESNGSPTVISTIKGDRAKNTECGTKSQRGYTVYSIYFLKISEQNMQEYYFHIHY